MILMPEFGCAVVKLHDHLENAGLIELAPEQQRSAVKD